MATLDQKNQGASLQSTMTVGVHVTGYLSEPKIQLFSNPTILSQSDILSMLVLGHPLSQTNSNSRKLILMALTSMGQHSNTKFLTQFKKSAGIDLDIQTASRYNLNTNQVSDSTGIVVGKSLSKRVYVSYNYGLSQSDPNILTLKYLINKFLSVQISSSDTSNAIDLLYTKSVNPE